MATSKAPAAADKDTLLRKRKWSAKRGRWSEWKVLLLRSQVVNARQRRSQRPCSAKIRLPLGGTLSIYPNLLLPERQATLTTELLDNEHYFRQYTIQGGPEPRAHFLLHSQATFEDFDASWQPGYRYGCITMKSRPLSLFPNVETLATEMLETCGVNEWNVGVNPVCYRDNRDHIGLHADNDQGEDKILTVLTKSPETPRGVMIQTRPPPGKSRAKQDGDVQYQLNVGAGDGYDMDGEMQQRYVHGVFPSNDGRDGRIALVLRHGTFARYDRDSGVALENVNPRAVIEKSFGRIDGLVEGNSYSRAEIRQLGAHLTPQAGVSGAKADGCHAIIVADARKDGLGEDRYDCLMYAAETRCGAASILTSMKQSKPIRVFRSSAAEKNPYKALPVESGPTQYRYDGLYRVARVLYFDEFGMEKCECEQSFSRPVPHRAYQFQFERINVGDDTSMNEKDINELLLYSIDNKTLSDGAIGARKHHETLQWPMRLVIPLSITPSPVGVPECREQTGESPAADAIPDSSGCPFECASAEEDLSQYYGLFPMPSFESRPVSPSQSESSALSLPAPIDLHGRDTVSPSMDGAHPQNSKEGEDAVVAMLQNMSGERLLQKMSVQEDVPPHVPGFHCKDAPTLSSANVSPTRNARHMPPSASIPTNVRQSVSSVAVHQSVRWRKISVRIEQLGELGMLVDTGCPQAPVVTTVYPKSLACAAGLARGDVLLVDDANWLNEWRKRSQALSFEICRRVKGEVNRDAQTLVYNDLASYVETVLAIRPDMSSRPAVSQAAVIQSGLKQPPKPSPVGMDAPPYQYRHGRRVPWNHRFSQASTLVHPQQTVQKPITLPQPQPSTMYDSAVDFACSPVEWQYRIAQMEQVAKDSANADHHVALRDFMRVALPLVYGTWDTSSYERPLNVVSRERYLREVYYELINKCLAFAKKFNNFQDRSFFYEGGSRSNKRRKVSLTMNNKSNGGNVMLALSKVLFALEAARQSESRKGPPRTKRHAIFASRESMQSQLTPSKSASSSGDFQYSKLKQAGKKTQASFGAPARKRKSGAPPPPPDEDSLVALGRKAGKRSSLTNTKRSRLINARIRQASKAKSRPKPSHAKLDSSHRTTITSILKERNDTHMTGPTNKQVESQVSNPSRVSLSVLDEKACGYSRSSGGEPRPWEETHRSGSAGVAAPRLEKIVSSEQRAAQVAVSSLSKNDEPREQEKLPSNVGRNSPSTLEKKAAAQESRTVGGEPHPPSPVGMEAPPFQYKHGRRVPSNHRFSQASSLVHPQQTVQQPNASSTHFALRVPAQQGTWRTVLVPRSKAGDYAHRQLSKYNR